MFSRASALGVGLALSVGLLALRVAGAEPRHRLYLSCPQTCFEPYLRQELSYFDLVRDRHEAELTLLVVRQRAANGGERFTVSLTRASAPTTPVSTREFSTQPGTQPEAARQLLLDAALRALYGTLNDNATQRAFRLSLPQRGGGSLSQLLDPWDYWAVSPELKGSAQAESAFHFADVTTALTLRRTTELNKLRIRGAYLRKLSGYVLSDGSHITGDVYGWEGNVVYARSIGRRWAFGFAATERGYQFENLTAHLHGGPVVELNLFPYAENVSKQIRLAYQAGPWANWYTEVNLAGKRHELRPYHALTLIADANQRWGSLQWALQYTSLLDEPGKYRLATTALCSLQLFEGLAFTLEGMGSIVREQLSLRARAVSDQELLLATAQSPTSFQAGAEFGLSYTFGSVHNTIVNPRFGRLDLAEE